MQKRCTHKKNCYKLIYLGGMQYFCIQKLRKECNLLEMSVG